MPRSADDVFGGGGGGGDDDGWDFGDHLNNLGMFDNLITTDEERAQDDLAQTNQALWQDVFDSQPTANDLMGVGAFAGQAPQEYIDAYLAEQLGPRANSGGGPGFGDEGRRSGPGNGGASSNRDRLIQEAQQQWLQEQMAADPYFGLSQLGTPEMAGATADLGSLAAQYRALRDMQGIYDAGGYTDAERAQLQMSQRDAAMGERSQRLAVQQQAAARGMGGGGMELMGALAAQQGGANRANDWANQIAVAGQQRALQALQNSGQMATQMRGQSFNEDAARRQARDAWTQQNVGMQNAWTAQRGDIAQQQFGNQLTATNAVTGGNQDLSDYYQAEQDRASANAANTVQTIGNIATGYATGGAGAAVTGGLTKRQY